MCLLLLNSECNGIEKFIKRYWKKCKYAIMSMIFSDSHVACGNWSIHTYMYLYYFVDLLYELPLFVQLDGTYVMYNTANCHADCTCPRRSLHMCQVSLACMLYLPMTA